MHTLVDFCDYTRVVLVDGVLGVLRVQFEFEYLCAYMAYFTLGLHIVGIRRLSILKT